MWKISTAFTTLTLIFAFGSHYPVAVAGTTRNTNATQPRTAAPAIPVVPAMLHDRANTTASQGAKLKEQLKSIYRAANVHYSTLNTQALPKPPITEGSCTFQEVKSLKLLSFSADKAELEVTIAEKTYSFKPDRPITATLTQWGYKFKLDKATSRFITTKLALEKVDGKWQVK
jgi:hypothetical protein